jgi:cytochrome P450
MTDAVDETVVNVPITRTCPWAPSPDYRRLQEAPSISRVQLPSGESAWAAARYEHVRAMLADPRFSSDRSHPGYPLLLAGQRRVVSGESSTRRKISPFSLLSMDAPEHSGARRAVLGEFTMRRMQTLRPHVQRIVDDCVDAMLAGPRPADLVAALSLAVPSLTICQLLGVPYSDHEFFQERAGALLRRGTSGDERVRVIAEMRSFLGDLVAGKEREPGDDLLSRQILQRRADGTPDNAEDHEELVLLAFLLLLAGHGTTANMISLGTLALLENPDALAAIRDDPGKTPDAVEELLRYFTVAETSMSRVATEDVEIGGTLVRAGEGVVGLAYVANRDPAAFADPDRLDIGRGARHHLAFGFGPHHCLGMNMARMELQIVFDTLLRRIPSLTLAAPVDELPFKDDANIYGLYKLPVTW